MTKITDNGTREDMINRVHAAWKAAGGSYGHPDDGWDAYEQLMFVFDRTFNALDEEDQWWVVFEGISKILDEHPEVMRQLADLDNRPQPPAAASNRRQPPREKV